MKNPATTGGRVELINAAQVGVGRWGRNIARTIRDDVAGINLACVATSREDIRDLIGEDCDVVTDWRDVLDRRGIDAVFLAVPAVWHTKMTSAFVSAGIAVFVEKPLCLSSQDGRALLKDVELAGGIVHVDHIDLHNPAVIAIHDRAKSAGPLQRIVGRIGAAYERRADISPLWEYAPHFIAVCLKAGIGTCLDVDAARITPEPPFESVPGRDLIRLELVFSSGANASLVAGNGMAEKCRTMRFEYDEVHFVYDDQAVDRLKEVTQTNGDSRVIPLPNIRPLTASIRAFEDKVRRGVPTTEDIQTGIQVAEILEAASRKIGEPLPQITP